MNNRSFLIYGGLFLLLIAIQVGVLFRADQRRGLARIVCRATNSGIPLHSQDGQVYVHPAFQPEQLVAEGELGEAIEVPAGRYDVRVLYSRSQDQQSVWIEDIGLEEGQRLVREVQFEAGEISVDASVGDKTAEAGQVVVYVLSTQDHDQVITAMGPNEKALLASGPYDLRVVLLAGSEEKEVAWLREAVVKSGIHTRREVAFNRGYLKIKPSNAGQELPSEAVTITVYRAGDRQEQVIDSSRADSTLSLAVGRYDAKVMFSGSSDQPIRWLKDLEVGKNQTLEEQVDFSSGKIQVESEIRNGGRVGEFEVYVYYYRVNDYQQPVAYTTAGETVTLESGRYDVRASFFRSHDQPDLWIRNLFLGPGKIVKRTLYFASGRLVVRAYDNSGSELVGDNVFVYVYAAGEWKRPLASARGGEMIVLTEGLYDIRAQDTRTESEGEWLYDVRLPAGKVTEQSVSF